MASKKTSKDDKKMQLDNKKWLLKETRKLTKEAAKERAKQTDPVPVDALVLHMKEVRQKAALEKAEMKAKEQEEFQRLLKQERFLSSKAAQHGKKFDPSGDFGNLADKEGKRAAVCWDVIPKDNTAREPHSYISGPFRGSTVAPVEGKPAWVPPEEAEISFTQTPCSRFLISEVSLYSMKERLQTNISCAQKSLAKTGCATESLRKERQTAEEGLASLMHEMTRLETFIESRQVEKEKAATLSASRSTLKTGSKVSR